MPWFALVVCAALWAVALRFSFERLISIDLVLYGASLSLEFFALFALRRREPDLVRPFRVPGGQGAILLLAAGPLLMIVFALWAARDEKVGPLPALVFAGLVAVAGVVLYALTEAARRRSPRENATA